MNSQAICSCYKRFKRGNDNEADTDSTMNRILQHKELFGMLKLYAIKELSVENVLFYETYHVFMTQVKARDVNNQVLIQKAEEICKEYCNTNGTYALNINADIKSSKSSG